MECSHEMEEGTYQHSDIPLSFDWLGTSLSIRISPVSLDGGRYRHHTQEYRWFLLG
jgi:hypothetical protein